MFSIKIYRTTFLKQFLMIFRECYKLVVVRKGHNDEVIEVNKFGNVASIKNQIENLLRISAIQQVLFFNRQYLDEDSLIIESIEGLASSSRIELFEFEPVGEAATATASTSAAQPSSAAAAGVHFPPESHRRAVHPIRNLR